MARVHLVLKEEASVGGQMDALDDPEDVVTTLEGRRVI